MKFAVHFSCFLLFAYSIGLAQSDFNRITCAGNITLNIKQGDSCKYTFAADSKSENANRVIFEVYNNTLHIEGGISRNAIANVQIKSLKGLNVSGETYVFCDQSLACDALKAEFKGSSKGVLKIEAAFLALEVGGAAQVELIGKAAQGDIIIDGASKVTANKCEFERCEVASNGASVCSLNKVNSELKVEARGSSKIYLTHIPETYVSSIYGLGKVLDNNINLDTTTKLETQMELQDDTLAKNNQFLSPSCNISKDAGFNWTGLDLGINGLMNSSMLLKSPIGYSYLEMSNPTSMQINLNLFEKDVQLYKRFVIAMVGAGFSWSNFKFTSPYVFQSNQSTLTAVYDSTVKLNSNKLRVSYFNVPILIGFNTHEKENKALHVAVGIITGIRLGAMIKTSTDGKGGSHIEKTFDDYNLEKTRFDAMVRLKYKKANFWALYSLTSLFKKNQGPEVHPIAVGVNILDLF